MSPAPPVRTRPRRARGLAAAFLAAALAATLSLPAALLAQGHPYESSLRRMLDFGGVEMDAPEGYWVFDRPDVGGEILGLLEGPTTVTVVHYVQTEGTRFYLTREGADALWDGRPPGWVLVIGTGRPDFMQATEEARLLKRETRDFFKEGPVTAEIYEETVPLAEVTEWGEGYRRAEVDFRAPAKVEEFRVTEGGGWELRLSVFPAFDSNVERIPGDNPDWDGPHRVLISRVSQRETVVRGPSRGAEFAAALLPGTVWAAALSEGRVQSLRLGDHDIQPPYEISKLSPPHFTRSDPMRFRFQTTRLLAGPTVFEIAPDRVVGVDWTKYDLIAQLGGPPTAEDREMLEFFPFFAGGTDHGLWQVLLEPDLSIVAVAPLMEGRGAPGMLELESIGLGPSFEDDLRALPELAATAPVPLPAPESPEWRSILDEPLGQIPLSQRGEETDDFF